MKRLITALMAFALFCFCMSGCQANQEKQEQNSKAAIREHLDTIHGLSVGNYESFRLNEDCSASATVKVTVALEGLGSMEMSCELRLDESCQITSCSLCNMGIGYNGGAQDLGESSTVYQSYIIDTAEQLTGFSISVEMGNYREQEIVENGHTYIDVFAFINIEEMAGTPIDVGSAFQLYALINPDNEEDLFIVITGNSTGEIYRYDHTSIPHETTDNDKSENNTSSILESEDDDYGQEDELVSTPENTDHEISRPEEDTTSTGKVTTPELIINETDQTVNSKYFSLSGYATDKNYSVTLTINGEAVRVNPTWGTWSRDYTLTEGKNVFTIVATNEVGKSTTETVTVVFNIGAPELTINETDQTVSSKYFSLSGYATDKNYSVTLTINGEAVRVNPTWGTWSRDYTLTEGKNVFTVVATNEAGKSTTETVTVVFNFGAPE
ncbi:hypothetical protein [Hominenteromicrobium sp.]|uniref:hypothetical protein n=1 Tax=Hominenteromicrobium sp. TaxID=3073581 RepID=UPI003AB4C20C